MRCILCDRCKKIVEDERKIKVVTYARPLNTGATCPTRADERSMNEQIWTKELCPSCSLELESFMDMESSDDTPEQSDPGDSSGDASDTAE